MTETLYVDPHHRLNDDDWAQVVARAKEIARDQEENKTGGAAPIAGPIANYRGTSGKHSGQSMTTQLLVLHSAECPLAPGYAQSLTEWAISSTVEASWHRFIGPDVRAYMIADNLRAWHASEANPMSIGWEQAGYARYSRADWLTPNGLLQLNSLAYDMAQVAVAQGIPPVWLTTSQVTAVTTYGDRATKGFCLHRQIDPETRTDPGDGYPYDLLMDTIRLFMGSNVTLSPAGTIQETELHDMAEIYIAATQAEDIAARAAQLVVEKLDNKVRINAVQAESIVQATTARTIAGVEAKLNGQTINAQQADDIARAAARYTEEELKN